MLFLFVHVLNGILSSGNISRPPGPGPPTSSRSRLRRVWRGEGGGVWSLDLVCQFAGPRTDVSQQVCGLGSSLAQLTTVIEVPSQLLLQLVHLDRIQSQSVRRQTSLPDLLTSWQDSPAPHSPPSACWSAGPGSGSSRSSSS